METENLTILVFYEEQPLSEAERSHFNRFKQEAKVEVLEISRDREALSQLVNSRNRPPKQTVVVSSD